MELAETDTLFFHTLESGWYSERMKIAVVTCYHDPDYVRARSLRAAVAAQPGVKSIVIKNKSKGFLRYPQVLWRMLVVKWRQKPAVFLITFRGQEILPLVLLIAGRTPVWFDEFIVPSAYARAEKHKKSFTILVKHFLARVSEPLYNFCLRRCDTILSDTLAHAELSARMAEINLSHYLPVPVGTDEKLFKPGSSVKKAEPFQIFYYTTGMQPLHGISYVLEAAERLAGDRRFQFLLVGGKKPMERAVAASVARGARIEYRSWVAFDELPQIMRESGLCLGGPFGGTPQAEHVITGKSYQSLACEVPTVVGSNVATEPFFKDKVNSIVVPQKDVDALIASYVWAVENPRDLAAIAERGRKLYEKEFSNEALARIIAPLVDMVR